jgi:hypothetical protein
LARSPASIEKNQWKHEKETLKEQGSEHQDRTTMMTEIKKTLKEQGSDHHNGTTMMTEILNLTGAKLKNCDCGS